jgi:hypothetical protein
MVANINQIESDAGSLMSVALPDLTKMGTTL